MCYSEELNSVHWIIQNMAFRSWYMIYYLLTVEWCWLRKQWKELKRITYWKHKWPVVYKGTKQTQKADRYSLGVSYKIKSLDPIN